MNGAENLTLWDPETIPAITAYVAEKDLINNSFATNKERLIRGISTPELKNEYIATLPFSDLQKHYEEGSVVYEGAKVLDIQKLEQIHSLSHLSYRLTDINSDTPIIFLDLYETRFNHVMVVAMTAEAIAQNLGLPEEDIRRLSVAALLHDRATPALGDATKKVDKDNLHEELYWDEGLSKEAWDFIHSVGLNREMIDQIIRNDEYDTLLGQILDIADKISYVMLDLQQTRLKVGYRDLGNIYKDVALDPKTGKLYFKDVDNLDIFLETRAQLFTHVYVSAYSQATDFVFENLLRRYYSANGEPGKLSPQDLRNMSDQKLLEILAEKLGTTPFWFEKSDIWYPEVDQFATLDEANEFALSLRNDPVNVVVGVKEGQGFNPATDFNVLDDDEREGEIITFKESRPFQANMFDSYSRLAAGYFVVYYKTENEEIRKLFSN